MNLPSPNKSSGPVCSSPPSETDKHKSLRAAFEPQCDVKPSLTRFSYFEARQNKIVAQAPKAETDVLKGVKIYFTGVKSTSQRSLERLVWQNGGEVLKVWYRKQVTHVIADCLAASKAEKELSENVSKRGQAIVVRPTWLQHSLREGKKLPTWKYQLVRRPDVHNVAKFFRKGKDDAIKKAKRKRLSTT